MARPARTLWVDRPYVRRRHRSWHRSMILATLGWSAWWFALLVHRIAPEQELSLLVPSIISTAAAVLGLAIALFALRAQRSWILFVLVPLFANTSLLLMPWMAADFFAR